MINNKSFPVFGLLLFSCFLFSCQQKENKNTAENKNMRIPVSVNDSITLSIDKSPMDMIYFPVDYPQKKMDSSNMGNPKARLIYSRPQKKGRIIFADSTVTQNFIQHYGQEWRLGANESTEVEFFTDVTINGQKLAQGRYIIYCIPYAYKWVIVFNDNLFSWGLHVDKTKDVMKIELPVTKTDKSIEFLTMAFQEAAYGYNLLIEWDDIKVLMPVNFN